MENLILIHEIEDILIRWKKHKNFLKIVKDSNINEAIYLEWQEMINNTFKNKIKSKL